MCRSWREILQQQPAFVCVCAHVSVHRYMYTYSLCVCACFHLICIGLFPSRGCIIAIPLHFSQVPAGRLNPGRCICSSAALLVFSVSCIYWNSCLFNKHVFLDTPPKICFHKGQTGYHFNFNRCSKSKPLKLPRHNKIIWLGWVQRGYCSIADIAQWRFDGDMPL